VIEFRSEGSKLLLPFASMKTRTPLRPGSPFSCTPSPSKSIQTRSPTLAPTRNPKSALVMSCAVARVTVAE
jgi:hypothetical protein